MTNHLKKSATAVVILMVGSEVLGQVVDSVGKKCDLYLRRTCVTLVSSILLDYALLYVFHHDVFTFLQFLHLNLSDNTANGW